MFARTALRTQRAARFNTTSVRRNVRFQSSSSAAGGIGKHLPGGIIGGTAALAISYAYYHYSGASSAVAAAKQAKSYIDTATGGLKVQFDEKTPDTDQAIKTLRDAANKYAGFVPGGKAYVDSAFNDLDSIRKKHGPEVDGIIKETYSSLHQLSSQGLTADTAAEATQVLSKQFQRLLDLGKDAADDILAQHPQLKEKLGGSADKLKQLGERFGPEAKREIDDTWRNIQDIAKGGLNPENIDRIRKLVQEKVEKVQKMGREAEETFGKGDGKGGQ